MIKFVDNFKVYSKDELSFANINQAKEWFKPDDEGLKEEADQIERCKDAFDLCEVLNEQESDSRWGCEEEEDE